MCLESFESFVFCFQWQSNCAKLYFEYPAWFFLQIRRKNYSEIPLLLEKTMNVEKYLNNKNCVKYIITKSSVYASAVAKESANYTAHLVDTK